MDERRQRLLDHYLGMRPALVRFVAARLGDSGSAEDVVQDLYLRLANAALPPSIDNPDAFIFRAAANLAGDLRRGRARSSARDGQWLDAATHRLGGEAVSDVADPVDAIDAKQRLSQVTAAVGELPPKCREVFILHKLKGLDHAAVADRLKISRKTVEKHMATALKQLARVLLPGSHR